MDKSSLIFEGYPITRYLNSCKCKTHCKRVIVTISRMLGQIAMALNYLCN